MSLKGIAKATLALLEQGHYVSPAGHERLFEAELKHAVTKTVLYRPDSFPLPFKPLTTPRTPPHIEVREGTTQAIARTLVQDENVDDLALLGFASARNVCGGFLNGARSQEEDLARSSGLYVCLRTQPDYYTINREQDSLLYTDHIIYSPYVPFFRETNRALLEHPFIASIITAPAPNTGQFLRQQQGTHTEVEDTLRQRAHHILAIAQHHSHRNLLLGAWGCGVFGNEPALVARIFGDLLTQDEFTGYFDRVIFGIYDRTPQQHTLNAFIRHFHGEDS